MKQIAKLCEAVWYPYSANKLSTVYRATFNLSHPLYADDDHLLLYPTHKISFTAVNDVSPMKAIGLLEFEHSSYEYVPKESVKDYMLCYITEINEPLPPPGQLMLLYRLRLVLESEGYTCIPGSESKLDWEFKELA